MKKIITCLLATLGLTTACGQNFENTDVEGFSELIENPSVVLLDVRTAAEYAEGHIDGAVLIDQGQDDFVEKAKTTIPTDKHLLPKWSSLCKCSRKTGSERLSMRESERRYHCLERGR